MRHFHKQPIDAFSIHSMTTNNVPIVAIATAVGRGGIGVIRASGSDLGVLMKNICGRLLSPRHATYLPFLDHEGLAIDHGIALFFPAPHSYTGEQVLELQAHGGSAVLQILLNRCLQVGAAIGLRLAAPGEFTQRAYLNDKLDLAQAEAVADLIEASTERAAQCAARSLDGAFSTAIHTLVTQVITLRTLVEATLDFPEEEIDFLERANAIGQLQAIREQLDIIRKQAKQGALLREGLSIVLVGQPNVGKSSLMNALVGKELAIVTPIAGTTRDQLQQTIQLEGIPLHIIDTAGLRDTDDEVEQIGVARSWQAITTADLVLHLRDAQQPALSNVLDEPILARLKPGTPILQVWNKIDLLQQDLASLTKQKDNGNVLKISAKTGIGIDALRQRLLEIAGWQGGQEGIFLARARHIEALNHAAHHLISAHKYLHDGLALDFLAEELRLAQENLNQITGAFTSDDLLGEIFGRFCIGK